MQPGVLLIRPHDQAAPLKDALTEHGYQVFHEAVIETRPVALDDEQWQRYAKQYDGIVVVSPAAVGFFADQLASQHKSWPQGTYYCVGHASAESLAPLTGQPVIYPAPAYTADALIELDGLQNIAGQNWLFLTGRDGRPLIAETLIERGAHLEIFEVYERVPLHPDFRGPLSLWSEQVGVIIITSQQQVELFWTAINAIAGAQIWLHSCTWIVSSARLKNTLLSYGIADTKVVLAENAGRPALVRAVAEVVEATHQSTANNSTQDEPMSTVDERDAALTSTQTETVATHTPKRKRSVSTKRESTPRRSTLSVFLTLILFLCVATLAVGGYWAWAQQSDYRQQTNDQLRELNARIDAADRAQVNLRDGVFNELDDRLSQRFAQLETERQRELQAQREEAAEARRELSEQVATERLAIRAEFDEQTSDLEQLKSEIDLANLRVSEDLYLVEARDLVLAAGRKLWFDFDRRTAIQLLERAEGILADAAQNRLLPIRQQLRNDIELLEGIEEPDLHELAIRISTQRSAIRQLPFKAQTNHLDSTATKGEISADFNEWRANLAKAWANFTDDFVRIQRTDERPTLQIGQQERALAVSQVELQLQIAQHALTQRQTDQFRDALEQTVTWIEAYFDIERQSVQRTLTELTELQSATLDPSYPTRLLSEAMLRDAVDELLEGASR